MKIQSLFVLAFLAASLIPISSASAEVLRIERSQKILAGRCTLFVNMDASLPGDLAAYGETFVNAGKATRVMAHDRANLRTLVKSIVTFCKEAD